MTGTNMKTRGNHKTSKYDFLIVGAGLAGASFAHKAVSAGKTCLVIDRNPYIAGLAHTEFVGPIAVHTFGAHIFHTNDDELWHYVTGLTEFNNFINSPMANYRGEVYNLPFNMNTFNKMWGTWRPEDAQAKIAEQRAAQTGEPRNLEEQAISLVGEDVYRKLVQGYTEKQWGRDCTELPAFIIRRLPVRFTYDNNYFTDPYQGIPRAGYDALVARMLEGSDVKLNTDFDPWYRENWRSIADRLVFTGQIDHFFRQELGMLEWRTVRFESERLEIPNYQGVAVMNFTDRDTPWTRIIEHKHFNPVDCDFTIVTREYPAEWQPGEQAAYTVNDERNTQLYERYREMAEDLSDVIFCGRLAEYKYLNMDQVILRAQEIARQALS